MNSIEMDMLKGMVFILNEASKSFNAGRPIISEEQYNIRLSDLKQLEDETNFMFANSPNCELDLGSVVEVNNASTTASYKVDNVESIVEFAGQNEMLLYMDVNGANMSIVYVDGILTKISIDNSIIDINKINNIHGVKFGTVDHIAHTFSFFAIG